MSNNGVSQLRRTTRYALWGVLALLLALGLVAVAIQAQQRLLRHRAERLLADVRALNLRQSDWSAAQELMRRWGSWGHYEGACNEQHCLYQVALFDFELNHAHLFENHPWVGKTYQALGGRLAVVKAGWDVEESRIWGKGFTLLIEVLPRKAKTRKEHDLHYDLGYWLMASAKSVSHFDTDRAPLLWPHSNYLIGTPSACTNCEYVYGSRGC